MQFTPLGEQSTSTPERDGGEARLVHYLDQSVNLEVSKPGTGVHLGDFDKSGINLLEPSNVVGIWGEDAGQAKVYVFTEGGKGASAVVDINEAGGMSVAVGSFDEQTTQSLLDHPFTIGAESGRLGALRVRKIGLLKSLSDPEEVYGTDIRPSERNPLDVAIEVIERHTVE